MPTAVALSTDSPHNVVEFPSFETFRQVDRRDVLLTQTERPVTDDAGGVHMVTRPVVVRFAIIFVMPTHAPTVFMFARTIVEQMQQLVLLKKSQRPEQGRTVHRRDAPLQFGGREGIRQFLYLSWDGSCDAPVSLQLPSFVKHQIVIMYERLLSAFAQQSAGFV